MQYSYNNSRKIPKLAQFIPGIYNIFYYKIPGYFWGVTECLKVDISDEKFAITAFLRWPSHMRSDPAKRDNTKYCEFYRDYGHRTDDCIQLRKEIEYLIRHGYLRCFIASEGQDQGQQPQPPR